MFLIEDFNEIVFNKSMTIEKNKFKTISIIAGILIFIAVFAGLSLSRKNSKSTVAFYGLSEVQVKAFEKEMKNLKNEEGKSFRFNFVTLDSSLPVEIQLTKKTDLLITMSGLSAQSAAIYAGDKVSSKVNLTSQNIKDFTISMQQATTVNTKGKIICLPLLSDTVQVLVDKRLIKKNKVSSIESISQLENFAELCRKDATSPIVFTGSDPVMSLNVLSALTEALSGQEALIKASDLIRSTPNNEWDFEALVTGEDAPLYSACATLARWKKERLLLNENNRYTFKDVEGFMAQKQSPVVFTTLEQSRLFSDNAAGQFQTIPANNGQKTPFIPSVRNLTSRNCVCPVICAVPVSSKKTGEICKALISTPVQEKLARASGLAPVLRQCRVPDVQADDVRFWIATTNAPVKPLTYSAFKTDIQRNSFVKRLNDCINSL